MPSFSIITLPSGISRTKDKFHEKENLEVERPTPISSSPRLISGGGCRGLSLAPGTRLRGVIIGDEGETCYRKELLLSKTFAGFIFCMEWPGSKGV